MNTTFLNHASGNYLHVKIPPFHCFKQGVFSSICFIFHICTIYFLQWFPLTFFFTVATRNVSKIKPLQFETIKQEISGILRFAPNQPGGSHYIKKVICHIDIVQFDAMRTTCNSIQVLTGLEDNSWFVLSRNWTATAEDKMQLVSSRVKLNGCCPRTQ